jgi:hypothetical protein
MMRRRTDVTEETTAVSWRRPLIGLMAWVGASVLLWPLLAFALSSDRGIDLTDEGLYLLEADPPSPTAAWGFPYGWHTGPLFRIVGYDVADFRTLGAVLLVLGSAALGVQALRIGFLLGATAGMPQPPSRPGGIHIHEKVTAAVVGGLGGLMYYVGHFRTPSYNWLVILGLVVAVSGLLVLLADPEARPLARSAASSITGLGLFLTIPAKPTTPILFALLSLPVVARVRGRRVALQFLVASAAVATTAIAVAVLTGVWPSSFLEVFLRAVRAPVLEESYTLMGAFTNVLRMPERLVRTNPSLLLLVAALAVQRARITLPGQVTRWLLRGMAVFATMMAAVLRPLVRRMYAEEAGVLNSLIRGRDTLPIEFYYLRATVLTGLLLIAGLLLVVLSDPRPRSTQRSWLLAALCLPVPLHVSGLANSSLFSSQPPARLLDPGLPAAAVGLVLLALLARPGRLRGGHGVVVPTNSSSRRGRGLVTAFIASMPVVAAFGSGNALHQQIQLSIAFFAFSALFVIGTAGDRSERAPGLTAVATGMVALALVGIIDSHSRPYWYPSEPFATQTVQTPVGHRGAQLRLDPIRSAWMTDLTATAARAGWEPDMRLYGATASWGASTIPWHLGARVPESVMPTLQIESRLRYNLEIQALDGWDQAWILVETPSETAYSGAVEASYRFADIFATAVGRRFPDDYVVIWTAPPEASWFANFELWKPAVQSPSN